jgi:hypothetical protein
VILGVPGTKRVTSTTSPRSSNKKSKTTTTKSTPETRVLRLLAPLVDTSVRVDVIGAGDSFTPLGLDSIQLKAGMVREIPVTAALPSTAYAFRVVADSPIVAGVFSTVNVGSGSDIAWSASTPSLSEDAVSADFDGTSYIFYSHDGASVDITTTGSSSALSSVTFPVPADNVVSWSPTKADGKVIAIRLHANGAAVYAARSLRTSDGLTTSPIRPISVTGRSTVPLADVGVGMPR